MVLLTLDLEHTVGKHASDPCDLLSPPPIAKEFGESGRPRHVFAALPPLRLLHRVHQEQVRFAQPDRRVRRESATTGLSRLPFSKQHAVQHAREQPRFLFDGHFHGRAGFEVYATTLAKHRPSGRNVRDATGPFSPLQLSLQRQGGRGGGDGAHLEPRVS
jgi:hypothetical protein